MTQKILNNYFKEYTIDGLISPETYTDSEKVISLVDCIEKTMLQYANEITYTQMRNIYNELFNADTVAAIHMLRPKIAYIQSRLDKDNAKDITLFVADLMREIKHENQISPFLKLIESMVAYHKQYNTKNH